MLSPDSLTYRRRLARELNALPDGFYASAGAAGRWRFTRARVSRGTLQGRALIDSPLGASNPGLWRWLAIEAESASDAYGRTVTASRAAVRA